MGAIIAILLTVALEVFASNEPVVPVADDFTTHELIAEDGERTSWHLDRHNVKDKGPLILFLAGSGPAPLFQYYDDGSIGYGVSPELLAYMDRAHILLVDKPGVPFAAHTGWNEEAGRPTFEAGPEFREMTRDQLAQKNRASARAALAKLGERVTCVALIGYSEGGQYVFDLARALPETTHAVAIAGNALPQWYDMVIEARLAAELGEIDRAEAQRRIEALYNTVKDVNARPQSGESWNGHDYRRWASFGPYAPIDDMLALNFPLLMIQGGADENAPILNTDYAMIAFLSAGKTNLTYWVYPDYDHFLTEPDPDRPDRRINRAQQVYDRLWAWMDSGNERCAAD